MYREPYTYLINIQFLQFQEYVFINLTIYISIFKHLWCKTPTLTCDPSYCLCRSLSIFYIFLSVEVTFCCTSYHLRFTCSTLLLFLKCIVRLLRYNTFICISDLGSPENNFKDNLSRRPIKKQRLRVLLSRLMSLYFFLVDNLTPQNHKFQQVRTNS